MKTKFNLSQEIRTVLAKKPLITGQEIYTALDKKFPKQKISEQGCITTYYAQRRKMNTRQVQKTVGLPKPQIDADSLQLAANFLKDVGNSETAVDSLKLLLNLMT